MARKVLKQPMVGILMFGFFLLALYQMHVANTRTPVNNDLDITRLPKEYQGWATQTPFCEDRLGKAYLHNFQGNATTYCESKSRSELTCFSNNVDPNLMRTDSFCIGGPAVFDSKRKQFRLQCNVRDDKIDQASSKTPSLSQLPDYWHETGPKYVFDKFVELTSTDEDIPKDDTASTAILVKREAVNFDMWHSMMEIMSTYMALDVLRMTRRPSTHSHYLSRHDFDSMQVIILDDLADGPFFDLWSLFARRPVIRLSNASSTDVAPTTCKNIINPLPGASNPLWQGENEILPCRNSSLLRAFSSRVLYNYNISTINSNNRPVPQSSPSSLSPPPTLPKQTPIQLTFINRKITRRLLHAEELLSLVRLSYPHRILTIHIIDYTALDFAQQLNITHRNTDILLGVHGAGLTHTMFLKPGSAVIEISPFNQHDHTSADRVSIHASNNNNSSDDNTGGGRYRYKNLAQSTSDDILYYRGESMNNAEETKATGNWEVDDVWMSKEEFLRVVREVIDGMIKRRGLT